MHRGERVQPGVGRHGRRPAASARDPERLRPLATGRRARDGDGQAAHDPRLHRFPDELYQIQYPAPGSPELARDVLSLPGVKGVALDTEWGLDHGTWAVLRRMYPAADIPVVQLCLDRGRTPAEHYALGEKLQPLRERGVLILGSGNMVHNLSMMEWTDKPFDWAVRFDQKLKSLIEARNHAALIDYPKLGRDAEPAIPTNEHYLPMLYALALRSADEPLRFFADKVTMGSISMRAFQIG